MRLHLSLFFLLTFLCSLAQLTHVTLDSYRNPNEPTVAIHPKTKHIVAASNTDNFYNTFSSNKMHMTSKYGVYGDPVLHYSDTTLFVTHLSKTPHKEYGQWFDRIVVQKIIDAENWIEKSYSVGYNQDKMQDKPWLSSDNHSTAYYGNVYLTWTEFDKYNSDKPEDRSRIRFARYLPQLDSFSAAITISDTTGDCLDSDNTLEGATTAVGKNGEIYAVWAGYEAIWLDKSSDGGITWGLDRVIAAQPSGWDMNMPHIMRANGLPFIASDTANDILYVTWADEQDGNADVWLMCSKDKGNTWSDRLNLSNDKTKTHQYFPNITVNQQTGQVYVAYYNFEGSNEGIFYNINISQYDNTDQLRVYSVNQNPIPLPGKNVFYGDYLDLDVQNQTLAIVYTANSFANKTSIEMSYTRLYQKYLLEKNSNNNTSTLAFIDEGDSLSLYINAPEPTQIGYKIWVYHDKKKVESYKALVPCSSQLETKDILLLSLKLKETEYIRKVKVVSKNILTKKTTKFHYTVKGKKPY